ncbi:NF-kappa-B inhibitor beta isoform X2 [Aphelocoma coerulescens]|uniref:NF-kappa-B inhibitor beta isoform X2 n=1 Tax=Aphelocoma coerulescens TaxID=39617 RepID=UPI003604930A
MAAAAPAAPAAPGEAKRPEGDEWCDSGLGSLGEGLLGPPLPASPGAESAEPLADPAAWLQHVLSFVTEDGDTALHLAVIHEHEEFLESILRHTEHSPYLDLQNDLGQVTPPCTWPSCAATWSWCSSCSALGLTPTGRSRAVAAAPCTWPWRPRALRWPSASCGAGRSRTPARSRGSPPCTAPGAAPTPACPPSCADSGPVTPPPATAATAATARAGPRTARTSTTTSSSTAGAAQPEGPPGTSPEPPWMDLGVPLPPPSRRDPLKMCPQNPRGAPRAAGGSGK